MIRILLLLLILALVVPAHAQSTLSLPFTFDGGNGTGTGCVNILSQGNYTFTPADEADTEMCFQIDPLTIGIGSYFDFDNLFLPSDAQIPNNGYLEACNPLTYASKVWGTRSDGTAMDGTQVGDSYSWPASTSCPQGVININVTLSFVYQLESVRVCTGGGRYSTCKTVKKPVGVLQGGIGVINYQPSV
jgi:hypothetical protein